MDNSQENNVSPDQKLIRLTEALNMQDLVSKDGVVFEVNFDDLPDPQEDFCYAPTEAYKYSNPACFGLVDEDTYTDGEPFEVLSSKMENLLEDGTIKKRILQQGYGDVLPNKAKVTINYNAYLEYNDEPFDSTYLRKKPFTFILNEGNTIPGLDIATQSMKPSEKSQFMVEPVHAYGPMGCLHRVPPDSTILYEIEVINYVDSGATISYPGLPEEEQRNFSHIESYVLALCAKGNDMFKKDVYRGAIKLYNTAVGKLETCTLLDYEEQERQQKLLLRLFTNLVVSYTKIQEPRRACVNCNKIYYICKGTSLKVPAKVYFNHGRCLILLSDYVWAEKMLKQAQRMQPQNTEITNELLKLEQKKKVNDQREVALAKAMFQNNSTDKESANELEITAEFKVSITGYCKELLRDDESVQYNLPENLTKKEIDFCRTEAEKHGLEVISKELNNGKAFVIAKIISTTQQ